jgi:O-antigen ligase
MTLYVAVLPAFALLLAGKRNWHLYAGIGAALLIAMSTASRATIGLLGAGLCLVFLISAARQWTSVKTRYAVVGAFAAMIVVPMTLYSLERRFQDNSMIDHADERPAFEQAAKMMLFDYPMGVGANNYVVVANAGGYLDQVEIFVFQSRQTSVHNAYWLALAETGYFGFAALLIWILHPLIVAFRCGWRNRRDPRGDMLLGFGVAMLMLYVHSIYEWVFFTFHIQYVYVIGWGIIAGTAVQLGYWRSARPNNASARVGQFAG